MNNSPVQRLRLRFSKLGALKYIGHLDLAKTLERIFRRAQLPLAYSQGFNARPRMQLANPLAVGFTSTCELVDIWLNERVEIAGLAEHLVAVSPPGLVVTHIEEVPLRSPALQTLVASAIYVLTPCDGPLPDLPERVAALLAQPSIIRVRRDKQYDLRPLIYALEVDAQGRLHAELSLSAQGTGRPDELLEALALDAYSVAIERVEIKLRTVDAAGAADSEVTENTDTGQQPQGEAPDEVDCTDAAQTT